MTTARLNLFLSFMKFVLLISMTFLLVNCKAIQAQKDSLIGNTNVERKFDEKGQLIYYKKVNVKHKGYRHRPHMFSITRAKVKIIEDEKVVVYSYAKSRMSMVDWPDGKVLKSKRIVWDSCGNKTITRVPAK